MDMATAQLQLIQSEPNWKLDQHTIEVGRAGLAQARAALARADSSRRPRVESERRSEHQDQLSLPTIDQAAA